MKTIRKSILILVTFIIFLIFCICHSETIIVHIIDYSKLFITKIFPANFLFYILSSLLIEYGIIQVFGYLLHINTSSFYVFLLSLISGFPSGAKYTKELLEKHLIDEIEANQIIQFSHFPNPLFIMGVVAPVLKDSSLASKILISLIFSNLILLLLSKKKGQKFELKEKIPVPCFSKTLSKAIYQAFNTLILIYGTSLFFYLISFFITQSFSFSSILFVLISGFFDLTKGVFSTTILADTFLQAYLILFFISFGGISIHMQVITILSGTNISYKKFFKGRIGGTLLSWIIFTILFFY